jgi:hypothetical protein
MFWKKKKSDDELFEDGVIRTLKRAIAAKKQPCSPRVTASAMVPTPGSRKRPA